MLHRHDHNQAQYWQSRLDRVYNLSLSLLSISINYVHPSLRLFFFPSLSLLIFFMCLPPSPSLSHTLSVTRPGSAPQSVWQLSLLSLSTVALQTKPSTSCCQPTCRNTNTHWVYTGRHTHTHTSYWKERKRRGCILFLQWKKRPWYTNRFPALAPWEQTCYMKHNKFVPWCPK